MAASVLSQRWSLHDVADVEGLCGKVLENRLRRFGAVLNEQENEDCLAYLLARSWWLYCLFDPWYEATRKRSFSTFLYRRLRFAVVDWFRLRHGDRRYQEEAVVLSLDHDLGGSGGLDELIQDRAGDIADDRSPDLTRILAG